MLTYEAATEYLFSLVDYERRTRTAPEFKLSGMEWLCAQVGHPERDLRALHIAGTKGKGSTAAMATAMLDAAGYKVGWYTSPHLISFRERIRIGSALISEDAVARTVERMRPALEALRETPHGAPSFFEAYTLLAFLYFAEQGVDAAVLEVGLGGRLDATNVSRPAVCGITTIGIDHTVELGNTIEAIAGEKAGIIKPGVPVVSAPQRAEAAAVIESTCAERQARLVQVGVGAPGDVRIDKVGGDCEALVFDMTGLGREYRGLRCPLLGDHQLHNAGVALGLVTLLDETGISTPETALRQGLAQVHWPGRLQVAGQQPWIILDCAHDEDAARALRESLEELFPHRRLIFVLGISQDKDLDAIGRELCRGSSVEVIATEAHIPRAIPVAELARRLRPRCPQTTAAPDVPAALDLARTHAGPEDLICITGSIFIVGEAMTALGIDPLAS
jgi:dihydrofolate synthase/folylpolyglutamate synthase